MQELTHFIGGKHVKGTSGRFADVMNPATGEVQSKVPLASNEELAEAVAVAAKAQVGWAATNPQKRARVLMKFVELLHRDMDKLAEALSREHGKTIPDAKGDIIRGLEVAEFCFGAPHLLKGEFTEGAGPGIDMYSLRQPLGVVAGITPFNFPAMIPMWKFCPAIAAGNAFILKPSERDPSVPLMLAELMSEAGAPDGILNVVNGDKGAVDAILDHPEIMAIGFVGSTPDRRIHLCPRLRQRQARAVLRRRQEPHDHHARCRHGPGRRRADRGPVMALPANAAWRFRWRCRWAKKTADLLIEKLAPRVEALKIGPYTAGNDVDFGPLVTSQARDRVLGLVNSGVEQGAKLVVDGRDFSMQGYENGYFVGGCLFDNVTPRTWTSTPRRSSGRCLSVVRAPNYAEALRYPMEHEYGNGTAIYTRDGDTARDFVSRINIGMVGVNVPIPVPLAYQHLRRLEEIRLRRFEPARARRLPLLHPHQDRDRALAFGYQGRRRVLHPDHGMIAIGSGE